MADGSTANRKSNMHKAEGERWSSEQDTVRKADRRAETMERWIAEGGGISNRPLGEEISNQESLPERGRSRIEHAGNVDIEQNDEESRINKDIER